MRTVHWLVFERFVGQRPLVTEGASLLAGDVALHALPSFRSGSSGMTCGKIRMT
jgi:hypothetical protein